MKGQSSKKAQKDQKQYKKARNKPTLGKWDEMNRKQRREMMRKMQSEDLSLEVVHPHAAGIDIGNESHYVAVPPSRDPQPVRCFGCTTAELKTMAEWLKQCGIRTAALQSTGVYWIAVYDILEEAGLEVYLVNARETKNLPGRKTDVQESQWLMKLHTTAYCEIRFAHRGRFAAADVLAAAPGSGAEYRPPHSAHAEGADANEYSVGQRDQRHQRGDRAGHPEGDSGWGTQSA